MRLAQPPRCRPAASASLVVLVIATLGLIDTSFGPHVSMRPIYYLPIALAVSWFGRRGAHVVAIACLLTWLGSEYVSGSQYVSGWAGVANTVITALTFVILISALDTLISLHREMEERIRARTASLEAARKKEEQLQQELLDVAESERATLGHELHDGLCQHLAATAMATKMLVDQLEGERHPGAPHASNVLRLIEEGIAQCRELARGLIPNDPPPCDLPSHLQNIANWAALEHHITCEVAVEATPTFTPAASETLARIAEEAVRNALKHAGPRHVVLRLAERAGNVVMLEVTNDGRSYAAEHAGRGGLGIGIMRRRAASLQADFHIMGMPEGGTRVAVYLPAQSAGRP